MINTLQAIEVAGIFPVVEIERLEDAVPVARALKDGGIEAMEITLRTPTACQAIKAVVEAFPDMLIGAGTVLSPQQVAEATAAGARFIVTPGFNPKVVYHCLEKGILIVPGIDSPTGIELALEAGLEAVKFFPAESRGGIEGLRSMAGPFKDRMKYLPLGGIGPHNIADYACCDKVMAVGGTWLAKNDILQKRDFHRITENAREAMALFHGFELAKIELNTNGNDSDTTLLETIAAVFVPGGGVAKAISPLGLISADMPGRISIACNNVKRAAVWLKNKAVDFEYDSESDAKMTNSVTLTQKPSGFTIRFIQK